MLQPRIMAPLKPRLRRLLLYSLLLEPSPPPPPAVRCPSGGGGHPTPSPPPPSTNFCLVSAHDNMPTVTCVPCDMQNMFNQDHMLILCSQLPSFGDSTRPCKKVQKIMGFWCKIQIPAIYLLWKQMKKGYKQAKHVTRVCFCAKYVIHIMLWSTTIKNN